MFDQSQTGQSKYIFDLFHGIEKIKHRTGFVLEVGSMDGNFFSNAAPFFKVGWKGICIEPDDLSFKKLQTNYLKNDKVQTMNICIVPNDVGLVTFYMANEQLPYSNRGLSTLDNSFAKRLADNTKNQYVPLVKLGLPLHILFTSFINCDIDYMTMDCECFDEKIILGTDFNIFRPKIIQSEFQYDIEIQDIGLAIEAKQYLIDSGYAVKNIPNSRDILAIDMTNCHDLNLTNFNLI